MLKTGDEKRNSYNYRDKFLKHNPGYFNSFYICSQCLKPITKDELEVDHIFPISRWWAPNHLINLVSTCRTCNRRKSDKISFWIQFRAVLVKIVEEIYILLHNLMLLLLKLIVFLFSYVVNYLRDQISFKSFCIAVSCIILFLIFVFFN